MPKLLPALRNRFSPWLLLFILNVFRVWAQEPSFPLEPSSPVESMDAREIQWYLSNASGMLIEHIPSRFAALRNEYCISIAVIPFEEIPAPLVPFYDPAFTVESRVLYENAAPFRYQWIYRDERGIARLNTSGTVVESGLAELAFVEIFNGEHFLEEEHQFGEDYQTIALFTYSNGILVKGETWLVETEPSSVSRPAASETGAAEAAAPEIEESTQVQNVPRLPLVIRRPAELPPLPDISDLYRYTRSGSLRAIERTYHTGLSAAEHKRLPFPGIVPGVYRELEFSNPALAYAPRYLDDAVVPPQTTALFSTDNRGRVLSEKRMNEAGEVWGETINTWNGDRLVSILWKSGDEELLTEYEYDEQGDRILERNFNKGVLERVVHSSGNREIEELYIDGKMRLRAVWEDGRKLSEERIRNQ